MEEQFQVKLLRLQADLHSQLRNLSDARKVLILGLRKVRVLFDADKAVVAVVRPGRSQADRLFTMPRSAQWDYALLTQYIFEERPPIPSNTVLAPVRRWGRHWAALALVSEARDFTEEDRVALFSITQILTDTIRRIDEKRTQKVRHKIEQKIADRQEPKDLIYDILHGLRSLTYYDHSASLLIARSESDVLELVAEQIAWQKARSQKIGLRLQVDGALRTRLMAGGVHLYERVGDAWRHSQNDRDPVLPQFLDFNDQATPGIPKEVAMLCAPIVTPDGTLGVLKISARRHGVLGDHEARLLREFVPLASLAVQFSVRTESLYKRVVQSERKHALANFTRGITHDINNALGAMMPLVQQMQEDVQEDVLNRDTLRDDLQSLNKSIQTCRRIFGGMLSISRSSKRGVGHGNLRRAIDEALSVLEDNMKRQSIEVVLEMPNELPSIRGSQGDLTQVFLNLCSNARDAMPNGGQLHIKVEIKPKAVAAVVQDTGCGIPEGVLNRVLEPFFTTKSEGNGLGLSICRSVIYDIGGKMEIESQEGEGTRLALSLPVLEQASREGQQ